MGFGYPEPDKGTAVKLALIFVLAAGLQATTVPQIAGWTTIAVNVLAAPATVRSLAGAIKKTRRAMKRKRKAVAPPPTDYKYPKGGNQ